MMKFPFAVAAIALALLTGGMASAAAPASPTPAMMKPVNALLRALNTNSAAPVRGIFTADAGVVDEFTPFVWSGPDAGEQYLASFTSMLGQTHISHMTGRLGRVIEFQAGGDRAYVCFGATIAAMAGGKMGTERGVWTFVLQRSGAAWRLRHVTWSTSSPM